MIEYPQTYREWAANLTENPHISIFEAEPDLFGKVCELKDRETDMLVDLQTEHLVWLILFAEVWHGQA